MSVDWKGLLGQGATTAAQYEILQQAKDRAGELPGQILGGVESIAGMARPYTEFKPFTVTTPSGGSSTLGPSGLNMTLGADQQQMVNALQQQAAQQAGMLGNVTPEQLMSQMSALRAPEQQRAQQQLDNRLAAQGRLGVQTAAYGGTPEQLAMQKAIQEQQSADALASIQGARSLQQQDINNLTGMLNASFMPQNQALASLSPAIQTQQIASGLNQTQANLLGQLGQQYISEIGDAGAVQSSLAQQQAINMMQGLFGNSMGTEKQPASFLGELGGGLFDYLGGLFSGGISDGSTGGDLLEDIVNDYDVNRDDTGTVSGDDSLNAMLGIGGGN